MTSLVMIMPCVVGQHSTFVGGGLKKAHKCLKRRAKYNSHKESILKTQLLKVTAQLSNQLAKQRSANALLSALN